MTYPNTNLAPDYSPTEDFPYMNERHRAYFHKILLDKQNTLNSEIKELERGSDALKKLFDAADDIDRASIESDLSCYLKKIEQNYESLKLIRACLIDLENGNYGYCKETQEEIGIKRLLANPMARFSITSQEKKEALESRGDSGMVSFPVGNVKEGDQQLEE